MEAHEVVIIGGGPAGLAAAVELYRRGVTDVLIVERERSLGGILRQCIHDGFGLTRFGTSLSGPEYAQRFIDEVVELGIPYMVNASVVEVSPDKVVTVAVPRGLLKIRAKAVILTMGCRERTRGSLGIPGERPAGVFTAGVAQACINLYNHMVGREIRSITGADCKRGIAYVEQEVTAPMRTISTSVAVKNGTMPLTSVRLDRAIPREQIFAVMNELRKVELEAPVRIGDCAVKDILGSGSNVIVTKNVDTH